MDFSLFKQVIASRFKKEEDNNPVQQKIQSSIKNPNKASSLASSTQIPKRSSRANKTRLSDKKENKSTVSSPETSSINNNSFIHKFISDKWDNLKYLLFEPPDEEENYDSSSEDSSEMRPNQRNRTTSEIGSRQKSSSKETISFSSPSSVISQQPQPPAALLPPSSNRSNSSIGKRSSYRQFVRCFIVYALLCIGTYFYIIVRRHNKIMMPFLILGYCITAILYYVTSYMISVSRNIKKDISTVQQMKNAASSSTNTATSTSGGLELYSSVVIWLIWVIYGIVFKEIGFVFNGLMGYIYTSIVFLLIILTYVPLVYNNTKLIIAIIVLICLILFMPHVDSIIGNLPSWVIFVKISVFYLLYVINELSQADSLSTLIQQQKLQQTELGSGEMDDDSLLPNNSNSINDEDYSNDKDGITKSKIAYGNNVQTQRYLYDHGIKYIQCTWVLVSSRYMVGAAVVQLVPIVIGFFISYYLKKMAMGQENLRKQQLIARTKSRTYLSNQSPSVATVPTPHTPPPPPSVNQSNRKVVVNTSPNSSQRILQESNRLPFQPPQNPHGNRSRLSEPRVQITRSKQPINYNSSPSNIPHNTTSSNGSMVTRKIATQNLVDTKSISSDEDEDEFDSNNDTPFPFPSIVLSKSTKQRNTKPAQTSRSYNNENTLHKKMDNFSSILETERKDEEEFDTVNNEKDIADALEKIRAGKDSTATKMRTSDDSTFDEFENVLFDTQ
jgi:hypothetical protein